MAGGAWSNELVDLIILSAAAAGFSGFFVYSPAPGPGNLIGSWSAVAGTDQYGNSYPAGLSVEVGSFTGVNIFLYSGPPALGNLIATMTSAAGTDAFGNAYQAGITSYASSTFWAQLLAGVLNFGTPGMVSAAQVGSS